MDTSVWHMQHFCKTLEMGGIGIWPQGVDFRQVHLSAPRLLERQDRTGQGRRRAVAICSHIQARAPPVSTPPPAKHPPYHRLL